MGAVHLPRRSSARAWLEGWGWLGTLRLILGAALAWYALTYTPAPDHPPGPFTEPLAMLLAAAMILTASIQLLSSYRSSITLARVGLAVDLVAVLGTLALYRFDPLQDLLILVPAVQGEAGVVLGLPAAFWTWGATSATCVWLGFVSGAVEGAPGSTMDLALRIVVGLVLTVGGGILEGELSEERRRARAEREQELENLKGLVGRLEEAEQKYRVLVEQTPALLYIDQPNDEQTPVYIGPQIGSIIGITRERYLADPDAWEDLIHPEDRARTLRAYAAAIAERGSYSDEYRLIRPDGRMIWVHDEAVVLKHADGSPSLVHGVMFDITDRRAGHEREERDRTYAEALRETALAAMRRMEPNDVLDAILGRAAALVGSVHGYVYAADGDREGLEVKAGLGLFKEWIGFRLAVGEGVAGRVVQTQRPLLIDDYDGWDGRATTFPSGILRAVVCVPLAAGSGAAGALAIARVERGNTFTPDDVEILTKFAEIASVALDNANLYEAAQEEIRQRKQAEAELAHMAFHDRLTDLPNRAMFEEILDLALARARRGDRAVAVLYLDLDNFKLINDSLGHDAGDELLRMLAGRLRRVVRDADAVARQGGDEFLFLLADLEGGGQRDDPSDVITRAEAAVERIRAQLARPFRFQGTDVYVSASIGIAIFPFHARDARTLLRYADVAMYTSKRADPGSTRVFSGEDPVGKLSLATRVRKAVEDGGFILHYQPIVSLADGQIVGSEALLRWPQPDGSIALPATFLPVIEEMGLIGRVGDWVLERVCEQARRWQDEGASLFTSWNLALPQLWQRDLAARILRTIRASGVDAPSIVIEMTESAAMSDPERTRHILTELHEQGIGLAIDDFGTGYSSLSRLKDLPVDILKIDRPFLAGLPGDHTAAATVRAIIQLAEGLGMRPLAEGIEQECQRAYLLENGCAIGQGFLFAKALPAAELSAWIGRSIRSEVPGSGSPA